MEGEVPEFRFRAIGRLVAGGGEYRQQSPRQGALTEQHGVIELFPGHNFETAAADLEGAEYIWVLLRLLHGLTKKTYNITGEKKGC